MKILITGGSSGIGQGLAEYFSEAHEVTVLDRTESKINGIKNMYPLQIPGYAA